MGAQRGTIEAVLWLWVFVIVVLIGVASVLTLGSGGSLADVYEDRPDRTIPMGRPLRADDLYDVRFATAVRGYRMDEVDALLARLRADLLAREAAETHSDDVVLEDVALADDPSPGPAGATAWSPDPTEPEDPGLAEPGDLGLTEPEDPGPTEPEDPTTGSATPRP